MPPASNARSKESTVERKSLMVFRVCFCLLYLLPIGYWYGI